MSQATPRHKRGNLRVYSLLAAICLLIVVRFTFGAGDTRPDLSRNRSYGPTNGPEAGQVNDSGHKAGAGDPRQRPLPGHKTLADVPLGGDDPVLNDFADLLSLSAGFAGGDPIFFHTLEPGDQPDANGPDPGQNGAVWLIGSNWAGRFGAIVDGASSIEPALGGGGSFTDFFQTDAGGGPAEETQKTFGRSLPPSAGGDGIVFTFRVSDFPGSGIGEQGPAKPLPNFAVESDTFAPTGFASYPEESNAFAPDSDSPFIGISAPRTIAVPEPPSLVIFAGGLLAMLLCGCYGLVPLRRSQKVM